MDFGHGARKAGQETHNQKTRVRSQLLLILEESKI